MYAYTISFGVFSSSIVPTLGTSGWLILTRRGLAPRKKRRASLGAHRGRDARCRAPPAQIPACGIPAPGSSKLLALHSVAVAFPLTGEPRPTPDPLFPATRFAVIHGLAYPSYLFPAASCAAPPPPSPCDRLSRLRVLWGGLTPAAASLHLAVRFSVATAPPRARTAAGLPSSRPLLSPHAAR